MRHRMATRRRISLAVGCALCIGLIVPASAAESFPLAFRSPADLPEPIKDSLQALSQKHAENMFHYLELKIKQIDEDCNLSRKQRVRLEVAALGAAQDALEEWLAPILSELATGSTEERESLFVRLGGPGVTRAAVLHNGQVVVQVRIGQNVIVERAAQNAPQLPAAAFFRQLFNPKPTQQVELTLKQSDVLNHPIFTTTLEAVLTAPQQERLAKAEEERERKRAAAEKLRLQELAEAQVARDAMRLQTRTERLAREVGRRLSLNDAQQKQVAEVIEQMSRKPVVRWRTSRSGVSPRVAADFTLPYLPAEKMQQILTPGQLAVWREIAGRAKRPAPVEQERSDEKQAIDVAE